MKKFFIAAILSVFALVGSQFNSCEAAMPYSEMYLGGLTVGSSYPFMVKIYGEPVQDENHAENNHTCYYGDSVTIHYNNYANKIQGVIVKANNGWKTPAGLAVGMDISRAIDIYGTPDYQKVSALKTAYCYFHTNADNQHDFGFIILFDRQNGKILELGLYGSNTMVSFDEYCRSIMIRMIE